MRTIFPLLVFVSVVVLGAEALRCQTEDGPAPEQLQRVIRKCMRRAGMGGYDSDDSDDSKSGSRHSSHGSHSSSGSKSGSNSGSSSGSRRGSSGHSDSESENDSSNSDSDDSGDDSDEDSDEESGSEEQSNSRRKSHGRNKHNIRHGLRFRRAPGFGGGFSHSSGSSSNSGSGSNSGTSSSSGSGSGSHSQQNNTDQDANCVMHCFLTEMKMTNDRQLPDKRKVVHVLTKDIRDRQLKQFMQDSVNECFQVLDLDRRKEKCEYSKNLISCMAEHGKANCDDWQDSSSLSV